MRILLAVCPVLEEDEVLTCRYCGDELAIGRYGVKIHLGEKEFLCLDEISHRCSKQRELQRFPKLFIRESDAERHAALVSAEITAAQKRGTDPLAGIHAAGKSKRIEFQ